MVQSTRPSATGSGLATQISLLPYENAFVRLAILKSIASSLFVLTLFFLILDVVLEPNLRGLLLDAACLAASFLWFWALSRMWRPAIALYSLLASAFLLVLPTALASLDFSLSSVEKTIRASIIGLMFACLIVVAGFSLAARKGQERDILVTAKPGLADAGKIFKAALGVHPICAWLPLAWQRFVARTLFVLAALVRGLTICLLLVLFATYDELFQVFQSAAIVRLVIALSGGAGGLFTGVLRYGARRFARVSAEHLTGMDSRPPVLFLRSFKDDQIELPRRKGWASVTSGVLEVGEPKATLDHVVVDEATAMGPVVALGVPGAPAPFGAARTFQDDEEWQNEVGRLAGEATAIIIVLDETEGVKWELSHIHKSHYSHKALYLLPPRLTSLKASSIFLPPQLFSADPDSSGTEDHTACARLDSPCIGWFLTTTGKFVLLTTGTPSAVSYVAASRLFRAYRAGSYAVSENEPVLTIVSGLSRRGPELPSFLDHDVDTLFQTKRGVVVLLKDARAIGPIDGQYVLFDTVKDYRDSAADDAAWDVIKDAEQKRRFLQSFGAVTN